MRRILRQRLYEISTSTEAFLIDNLSEKSTFSLFLASTRMSRSFFGFDGKSSIVPVVSNFLDNFVIASAVGHGLFLNLLL